MTPEKFYETTSKLSLSTLILAGATLLLGMGTVVASLGYLLFWLIARL